MRAEYAQLPPAEESADRIFLTENAVIVLDGATAFVPVPVSGQTYADHLGRRLAGQVTSQTAIDLRDALAAAIQQTAAALALTPGESPSSTVTILRERSDAYDVLVLGDSPALWGTDEEAWSLIDGRLTNIAAPEREQYQSRLREGHGYDERHRRSLVALQSVQQRYRNAEGGYWIAEATPDAACQALVTSVPRESLSWAVLATDGAYNLLNHQGRNDWSDLAAYTSDQLSQTLQDLQSWERDRDPHGKQYPRAKRHDDKTLVAIRPIHQ